MKTKAIRLHGVNDLRLEEFELPEMKDTEILAEIFSDSICMSTYKAAIQGAAHKRVPDDVAENPTIMGHEFCGIIRKVGSKWADKYKEGEKFVMQTALNYKGSLAAPGYSYPFVGGEATWVVIPEEVMIMDCLLKYDGEAFFYGSLAEPMSCIVGGFHGNYHTVQGKYIHEMGIRDGGCMAILAGAGPMGLGAIDYAIHANPRPRLLVVTDIDQSRLDRASQVLSPESAAKCGVELHYVNTGSIENAEDYLRELTGGHGYDDLYVFAPVKPVVEMGDRLLARDGCLNFFAGPSNPAFSAEFNFYDVHYNAAHIAGTSGGNTDDMREALEMMSDGRLNPTSMITHIGGLDAAAQTTLDLPHIPGGKKLIYTHISLPLTALADLSASEDPMLRELGAIVDGNKGLWCAEAEEYLLANAKPI